MHQTPKFWVYFYFMINRSYSYYAKELVDSNHDTPGWKNG